MHPFKVQLLVHRKVEECVTRLKTAESRKMKVSGDALERLDFSRGGEMVAGGSLLERLDAAGLKESSLVWLVYQ